MTDLETRLVDLGDQLDLDPDPDDTDELVAAVLARLDEPATARTWLRVAAIAVLVVGAALAVIPTSRQAIADWFGLDGVDIDRQPDLSVPATPPPVDDAAAVGTGTVVEVDGTQVLVGKVTVGQVDGQLDEGLVSKTLASDTQIQWVEVDGNPGLWIDGQPHVVMYLTPSGEVVTERVAGNTLLWQDGDVIRRVEGFPTLPEALAYAEP